MTHKKGSVINTKSFIMKLAWKHYKDMKEYKPNFTFVEALKFVWSIQDRW